MVTDRCKIPALGAAALCIALTGCREPREPDRDAMSEPRVEVFRHGEIELTVRAAPPRVRFDRDILLTLEVAAPASVDVSLPEMRDRLRGFVLNDRYEEEAAERDGRRTRRIHMRLTPTLAEEYRLAPMPIRYVDSASSPARHGWFPTRPVVFEVVPPVDGKAPSDIDPDVKPVWIYPPFKTVLLWVVAALLACGVAFLLWKLLRRVHHDVQMRRLSPKERALRELALLLGKRLVEQDRIKDFYLQLTMVVRRYIERQHGIRAPEQTTEEFLEAVTRDTRFRRDVVARLRSFLEAADLVKFAAHHPDPDAVRRAIETAREYIESDAPLPTETE